MKGRMTRDHSVRDHSLSDFFCEVIKRKTYVAATLTEKHNTCIDSKIKNIRCEANLTMSNIDVRISEKYEIRI